MNKFLKSTVLSFVFMAVTAAVLCASPAAINSKNLPQTEEFTEKFNAFVNTYDYLRYYENQTYEEPAANAQALLEELNAIEKPNCDEMLLKLLVMRCLYNQDKCPDKEIDACYETIVKAFPKCAEVHWIYGNYLSTTMANVQSLEEMDKYIEMRKRNVNTLFIEDYAYVNMICGKRLTAMKYIQIAAQVMGCEPSDFGTYLALENEIKESSPDVSYTYDQVWKIKPVKTEEDESYFKMESTLIGISLPVEGDWTFQYSGYDPENGALIQLSPDSFEIEGNKVGITLVIFASTNENLPQNLVNQLGAVQSKNKTYNGLDWQVYTYENPQMYQDLRKGAKGYIYTVTVPPTEDSGLNCEYPFNYKELFSQEDGESQVKYYTQSDTYTRLNVPLTYVIFVDTCNALSKETDKFMKNFMSEAVFE